MSLDSKLTAFALYAAIVGSEEAILNQEAQGAKEMVNSDILPRQSKDWSTLIEWGVIPIEDKDDLFYKVTLPEGWKKVGTGHPMWTDLVDNRGLVRASIFYKAAFYDRDAFIRTNNRYYTTDLSYKFDRNDPKAPCKLPAVRSNEGIVAVFEPIYYAHKTDNKSKVGLIQGDKFYTNIAEDKTYNQGQLVRSFAYEIYKATEATTISEAQFYSEYHHVKSEFDLLDFMATLHKDSFSTFMGNLPTGDEIWTEEYDYLVIDVDYSQYLRS